MLPQHAFCTTPTDIDLANRSFHDGQYAKAIEYYRRSPQSIIDSSSEVKYRIGLSHFMLGDFQQAVRFWAEAKKQNPKLFEGRIFRIPSVSMEPQLIVGDLIIGDTEHYKYKPILREDVIIFNVPNRKDTIHIKRVIGLPDEVIQTTNGEVFINGSRFQDRHASFVDSGAGRYREADATWGPIPKDSYFVLGDNRNNSQDSRHYGLVPKEAILGKALVIYGSVPEKDSLENMRPERMGRTIE